MREHRVRDGLWVDVLWSAEEPTLLSIDNTNQVSRCVASLTLSKSPTCPPRDTTRDDGLDAFQKIQNEPLARKAEHVRSIAAEGKAKLRFRLSSTFTVLLRCEDLLFCRLLVTFPILLSQVSSIQIKML